MSATRFESSTRLFDKVAVIFGAGGEVGAAVAAEFAAQGAHLYLSGRTEANVQAVADAIAAKGGTVAGVARVDALDEAAVNAYLDQIAAADGAIDVVFNAMGPRASEYGNATRAVDLPVEKFMLAIRTIVASQFITARSAVRHLTPGSGVVIFLGATVSQGLPNTAAIGAAYGALESLTRSLAVELGPRGVRVVGVRSMGMAETRTMRDTYELGGTAMGIPPETVAEAITSRALLGRTPTVVDTAKLVSFLASDEARAITGAIVNSSGGQVLD